METVVLDSSFLLSLTKLKDSNHQRAKNIFRELSESSKVIIPAIVIAESLVSSVDLAFDLKVYKRISSSFEQTIETDYLFFQSIPLDKRKTLKANDCCILAICKRKKAKLLTFDSKLEKLAREYIN